MKRAAEVAVPPLSLDRRRPLVRQISEGLRAAIQSGRLKPNDRVPATRPFAHVLGVSRQVIVSAYEELVATGHLRGRTGDGSYVARAGSRREGFGPSRVIADPDGYAILIWPRSPIGRPKPTPIEACPASTEPCPPPPGSRWLPGVRATR